MAARRNAQFGARLAALRRSAGLSQADAAAKAGIANETLSRIERGSQEIRLENLQRLAGVYGISMAELFTNPSRGPTTETDALLQEIGDLLRRQRPEALSKARKLLYVFFDEEPPALRIRRKNKPKKTSTV